MKKVMLGCLIASIVGLGGCKKEDEDVLGCTDPDAISFNSNANTNDFSCTYEGSVNFWYNEDVATELEYYDSHSLKFYIDGDLIGSKSADVFFTSSPGCGAAGSVPTDLDLGVIKEKEFLLQVIDQDDYIIWEADIDITANVCKTLELTKSSMFPD